MTRVIYLWWWCIGCFHLAPKWHWWSLWYIWGSNL